MGIKAQLVNFHTLGSKPDGCIGDLQADSWVPSQYRLELSHPSWLNTILDIVSIRAREMQAWCGSGAEERSGIQGGEIREACWVVQQFGADSGQRRERSQEDGDEYGRENQAHEVVVGLRAD